MFLKINILISSKLFLLPFFLSIFVLSVGLNKPFVGQHDFNSVQQGNIAKNYLKYSPLALKFGQIMRQIDPSASIGPNLSYYTSYLPTTSLLIYLSYLTFGIGEWQTRLIPLVFSAVGATFFYLTVSLIWNKKIGILSSFFYIFNPMFIYYGKMPVFEPLILGAMMASYYFFVNYLLFKKSIYFAVTCIIVLLGGLIGWPMLYIGFIFILISVLVNKFEFKFLTLPAILLFTILLQFFHSYILMGSRGNKTLFLHLSERFKEAGLSFGGVEFTWKNYIRQEISWMQAYYTKTLIILSTIFFLKNIRSKLDLSKTIIFSLLILGLLHPVIFHKIVFIHDYLNIYLLPLFALSGALGLIFILKYLKQKKVNKLFLTGLSILILIIFTFEKINFTKALLDTQMNKPGYEMGLLLNKLQTGHNQAAIVSPRFDSFYGIFSNFYSKYYFSVISEEDLKVLELKKYKYIITFDEDIQNKDFFNTLAQKYRLEKDKDLNLLFIYD